MKTTLLLLIATLGISHAQVHVNPYYRRDGSYVPGHERSYPDGNPYNNKSAPSSPWSNLPGHSY